MWVLFDAFTILADQQGQIQPEYEADELHLNKQGYAALNQELLNILATQYWILTTSLAQVPHIIFNRKQSSYSPTWTKMEALHQSGTQIAQRYKISYLLGRGATGKTYAATDLQTGEQVAIKEMSMRRAKEWKELDVFEREARVLSVLEHPAIPNYIDYFEIDTDTNRYFYIVQELAIGKSLSQMVVEGWRTDEAGVKAIARQILAILVYLHRLTPPVIHRDIKPEHAICRQDGQIYLVDFGSVRSAFWSTNSSGATVVGTFGYMAPEQDRGQVYPASDLYGLGSVLLFLLTHRSPAELPQRRLKIDFRSHVQVSEQFADWLDLMLEPMVEDRFHSALQALRNLPA